MSKKTRTMTVQEVLDIKFGYEELKRIRHNSLRHNPWDPHLADLLKEMKRVNKKLAIIQKLLDNQTIEVPEDIIDE